MDTSEYPATSAATTESTSHARLTRAKFSELATLEFPDAQSANILIKPNNASAS
jgi:hypothetical protein